MTADREITINQQPVQMHDLPAHLREIFDVRREKTLYVSAAAGLAVRAGDGVVDVAKGAGVSRVGIMTEDMRRSATPMTASD